MHVLSIFEKPWAPLALVIGASWLIGAAAMLLG
jgi:hypothetical protein